MEPSELWSGPGTGQKAKNMKALLVSLLGKISRCHGSAVYNPFEPDIVLIYANPAPMMLMIRNALQFEDYEVM